MPDIGGDQEPKSGAIVNALVLFWLVGTLLLGKDFSYLSIGPLYITELVLLCLIAGNIRKTTLRDAVFVALVGGFAAAGVARWGNPVIVGKDLCWLYYLLFLRFFPRNFPRRYQRIVVGTALLTIPLVALPYFGIDVPSAYEKYRTGIGFLFLFLLFMARQHGKVTALQFAVMIGAALLADFKTLLFMPLLSLVLVRYDGWSRWRTAPLWLFSTCLALVALIYVNASASLLAFFVDSLNKVAGSVATGHAWDTDTSLWRARIWTSAIERFVQDGQYFVGELPGHNFLDWRFLGERHLPELVGGEYLGVVRTPHNIVVLIVMRTGILGLAAFTYFYWRWLPKHKYALILNLCIFICALTADILEVPSRGPLLFALTWLLVLDAPERQAAPVTAPAS